MTEHSLRSALAADEPGRRRCRALKNAHRIPEAVQLVLARGYGLERACKEVSVAIAPLRAALHLADPERRRYEKPSRNKHLVPDGVGIVLSGEFTIKQVAAKLDIPMDRLRVAVNAADPDRGTRRAARIASKQSADHDSSIAATPRVDP